MAAKDILFFYEDTQFKLKHLGKLRAWLYNVAKREDHLIRSINFIFCSDNYLFEMNKSYLDHHDLTDIITFDNSESIKIVGDIFISIDRAMDNSNQLNISLDNEVNRLMVHGLLHLLGYKDKSKKDRKIIGKRRNNMWFLIFLSLLLP